MLSCAFCWLVLTVRNRALAPPREYLLQIKCNHSVEQRATAVHRADGAEILRYDIIQRPRSNQVSARAGISSEMTSMTHTRERTHVQKRLEGNFIVSPTSQSMSIVVLQEEGKMPACV